MKYQEIVCVIKSTRTEEERSEFVAKLNALMRQYEVWQIWAMLTPEDASVERVKCIKCGHVNSPTEPKGDGWECEVCW